MTITDFLLARIEEDEAAVRDWELHTEAGAITRELTPWELLVDTHEGVIERTDGRPLITISPDRVKAEARSLRLLVQFYSKKLDRSQLEPGMPDVEARIQERVLYEALRLLALPFSEHEDYDERWKL